MRCNNTKFVALRRTILSKPLLSIIIPCVNDPAESTIIKNFDYSARNFPFDLQFVCLVNKVGFKDIKLKSSGTVESYNNVRAIVLSTDRYYGSCEENIYRVQDVGALLGDLVFIIGEHDAIDWNLLSESIDFFMNCQLDVMGWNILSEQKKLDESYIGLKAITHLGRNDSLANQLVSGLFTGQAQKSRFGSAAMLSIYGPIDWYAFIGAHLFRVKAFLHTLQYSFPEFIYSFVYKQLISFQEGEFRYGYYGNCAIHRRSDDFKKIREGVYTSGWLSEHRSVRGLSSAFSVANLAYLYCLRDNPIFGLVSGSLTLAHVPNENEEIGYVQNSFLRLAISWSISVLRLFVSGKSHYLPTESVSANLVDLRYVYGYWRVFLKAYQENQSGFDVLPGQFSRNIRYAVHYIDEQLGSVSAKPEAINRVIKLFSDASAMLDPDLLYRLNEDTFAAYTLNSKRYTP